MRLQTLLVAVSLVAPACGGDEAPQTRDTNAAAAAAQRATLRPGDVHRYEFSWSVSAQSTGVGVRDLPVTGDVELAGELSLKVYEETPDGVLVGVSFSRLDNQRIGIQGHDVLPGADMLLRQEAMLRVPADARPREVLFAPDSQSVFRHLMSGVLAHVDLTVPRGSAESWEDVGPTGNGLARFSYARPEGDPNSLTRRVNDYVRVDAMSHAPEQAPWEIDSEAAIALDGEALAASIELTESLVLHGREDPFRFGSDTKFSMGASGDRPRRPGDGPRPRGLDDQGSVRGPR